MLRLDGVIEDVKAARQGKYKPWIYDDNGKMLDSVICGEVLDLLEELKDYEIEATDEWIDEFISAEDTKGYNTYNNGANISNDLNYWIRETEDECIMAIAVHLQGDIRGGYSDYFVVKFEDIYEWFSLESRTQHKPITDTLTADIDIFSECYEVYDYSTDDYIGSFYEVEVGDLMEKIYNTKEETI